MLLVMKDIPTKFHNRFIRTLYEEELLDNLLIVGSPVINLDTAKLAQWFNDEGLLLAERKRKDERILYKVGEADENGEMLVLAADVKDGEITFHSETMKVPTITPPSRPELDSDVEPDDRISELERQIERIKDTNTRQWTQIAATCKNMMRISDKWERYDKAFERGAQNKAEFEDALKTVDALRQELFYLNKIVGVLDIKVPVSVAEQWSREYKKLFNGKQETNDDGTK